MLRLTCTYGMKDQVHNKLHWNQENWISKLAFLSWAESMSPKNCPCTSRSTRYAVDTDYLLDNTCPTVSQFSYGKRVLCDEKMTCE